MRNLSKILTRAEKLFTAGNLKKSYEVSMEGIQECSEVNKELNEENSRLGFERKAFDYKGNYKVQGKKLELWMEKFWNIIESTGIEPIVEEYETDMIQYDVYNNIVPLYLREDYKKQNSLL
jgi:hypothetical protein